jgi:alkylation response protein AidB-like acyl-CoA dehydrogenase
MNGQYVLRIPYASLARLPLAAADRIESWERSPQIKKGPTGLDYSLTDEQVELQRTIRDFCVREVPRELLQRWDEEQIFPRDIWLKLGELGLYGLPFAEEYGGYGGDVVDEAIVVEELSRGANPLANAFITTVSFGGYSILLSGSEEQKKTLLPRISTGELQMALALTEPEGGTDLLGGVKSQAVRDGDEWVISGSKIFCSGALEAELLIVLAITDREPPKRTEGLSMFLVPTSAAGIEITPQEKVGNRVPHSCFVFFDEVRVAADALLGVEGKGFRQIMQTLNNERILIASQCLGYGRGALEDGVAYAKQRIAFGKPIGQFQAVQHMLAEAAMELELARNMTYKAAWLQSRGLECQLECSVAKWAASEAAVRATERGMQVMGGHGYMMEHAMQRYWRDARLYTFSPITNEMVKNLVGESLGLPRSY